MALMQGCTALRIVPAYFTVSEDAELVLAGTPLVALVALKECKYGRHEKDGAFSK